MLKNKKINANDLNLRYTIPVGEYIVDEMIARGQNQIELAILLGIDVTKLNKILRGTQRLTADVALKIEQVWGIPAHIYLNLQSQYEIDRAIEEEKKMYDEIKFSYNECVDYSYTLSYECDTLYMLNNNNKIAA